MLWLALCLPALPLQLAERGLDALGRSAPLAIIEGPPQRPLIAFCNPKAAEAGIAPGQKFAAAQALAADLLGLPRNPERERQALHELACWGYQFSAQVVPFVRAEASGLLLETGASHLLFDGHDALHRQIRHELRGLGYAASFGYATTPRAAQLIALARLDQINPPDALEAAALEPALAPLPIDCLEWDEATQVTLRALGLRRIGDLLRLPRAAFARRFGPVRLDELDRALGHQPDPQPPFTPPERFDAALDLPADLTETAQLLLPAQRLLRALEGFLRGRGAGVTELTFNVHHSPRRAVPAPPTPIRLQLAAPERGAARLGELLAERLERIQLPQPAIALALAVDRLQSFTPRADSLLPPGPDAAPAQPGADWIRLAETLHARLGSERVFQFATVADHRPEYAYQVTAITLDGDEFGSRARPSAEEELPPRRPLLLLRTPEPLAGEPEAPRYRGTLTLLAGPERIEAGWWEFGDARRRSVHSDYFVARNPDGQTLWVYRELTAPRGWYLHGFFA